MGVRLDFCGEVLVLCDEVIQRIEGFYLIA